jgi:hypothetical protein
VHRQLRDSIWITSDLGSWRRMTTLSRALDLIFDGPFLRLRHPCTRLKFASGIHPDSSQLLKFAIGIHNAAYHFCLMLAKLMRAMHGNDNYRSSRCLDFTHLPPSSAIHALICHSPPLSALQKMPRCVLVKL